MWLNSYFVSDFDGGEKMSKDNIGFMKQFLEFFYGKKELLKYFTVENIDKTDKQIILERMIENTVDDFIMWTVLEWESQKGKNASTQLTKEKLTKILLDKLMMD